MEACALLISNNLTESHKPDLCNSIPHLVLLIHVAPPVVHTEAEAASLISVKSHNRTEASIFKPTDQVHGIPDHYICSENPPISVVHHGIPAIPILNLRTCNLIFHTRKED